MEEKGGRHSQGPPQPGRAFYPPSPTSVYPSQAHHEAGIVVFPPRKLGHARLKYPRRCLVQDAAQGFDSRTSSAKVEELTSWTFTEHLCSEGGTKHWNM